MSTKPTRQPLGRGLSSLLGDIAVPAPGVTPAAPGSNLRQIPVDLLDPNPFQPREHFAPEALDELAASIRERGVLQPILARVNPAKPERFFIVAGERRWRAAMLAGLHEIPGVVREMTDTDAAVAALIENLQREDLNPMEEAEGYNTLLEELELTQEKLAEAVGKSRTQIANALRLLNLPQQIQDQVRKGTLSFGHARALLSHPEPETLAALVQSRGLTVRQTEALAMQAAATAGRQRAGGRKTDPDMVALERRLADRLGFQARVSTGRKGHFSVVLDFADLEQLEGWVTGLGA